MSLDAQTLAPLFELSRDAVIGVGGDRRVFFANPAAELLLGARVGDPADSLLPAPVVEDPAERFVTGVKLHGFDAHISAVRTGGVTLYTIVRSPGQPDPSPAPDRALQELGSDLLSLRLAADALMNGTDAEADKGLRVYAAILYRSYYRIKRLQEHLALSHALRQRTLPFSPRLTDLSALCAELCQTVGELARPMEIGIRFEASEGDMRANADHRLMETLLLNLLSNSLLHASEGDTVRVTLTRQERRLVLAVDDPGRGIPPQRLAELFAGVPAQDLTDTAAGPGLGLAIVRGIAELHGGALILESREGIGTRTRVWLPLPAAEDLHRLHQPESPYRVDGMNAILTELSVALDKSWYNKKTFD